MISKENILLFQYSAYNEFSYSDNIYNDDLFTL